MGYAFLPKTYIFPQTINFMEITLRSWQKEAYSAFKKSNFNGILKVGTGKGKTVFGIYCIQEFLKTNPQHKTCIIVPTINLLHQWKNELIKFMGVSEKDIGLFYGGKKDNSKKIVIYVVNSAVNDSNILNHHNKEPYDLMIADECHHYGANLFSKIFKTNIQYNLGLSATPERENDKEGTIRIIEGIGPKLFELNHMDDPDAIPPFNVWSVLVKLTSEESMKYEENSLEIGKLNNIIETKLNISPNDKDYMQKIMKLAKKKEPIVLKLMSLWSKQSAIKYQANNKLGLLKEIIKMEKDNKIIIFNERIKFTQKICDLLNDEFDLNIYMVHSGLTKTKVKKKLTQFKHASKGILIAPKLIDEGYDVPDASVAIIVSFSGSARQMIQRDGRILRKINNKKAVRYSFIVEDVEEEKYFSIMQKSDMVDKALDGSWLRYDSEESTFSEAEDFKKSFVDFEKNKKKFRDQFDDWIVEKLNYYEENLEKDPREIEKRVNFFSRYLDLIENLSENSPERWPKLKGKLKKNSSDNVKFVNNVSLEDREELIRELRKINTKLILPNNVFDAIMRFIMDEEFTFCKDTKEYMNNLLEGNKPDVWPERLYDFLKKDFLIKLNEVKQH
jgi:superfamily II DNA or RNA helicase